MVHFSKAQIGLRVILGSNTNLSNEFGLAVYLSGRATKEDETAMAEDSKNEKNFLLPVSQRQSTDAQTESVSPESSSPSMEVSKDERKSLLNIIRDRAEKINNLGLILGMSAAFCYAATSVSSKVAMLHGIHSFEVLAYAKVVNMILALVQIIYTKSYQKVTCRDLPHLAVFSLFISAAVGTIFWARDLTSPVEAGVLQETHCIFTIIISTLLFGFKPQLIDGLIFMLMFSGVFLISRLSFVFGIESSAMTNKQMVGTALALVSGLFASAFSCYKVKIQNLDGVLISGITSMAMVVIFGPICYVMGAWRPITDVVDIISILISGLFLTLGSCIHLMAINSDSVVKVSFGLMCNAPFVAILQLLLLRQIPHPFAIIGIILVMAGSIVVTVRSYYLSRYEPNSETA